MMGFCQRLQMGRKADVDKIVNAQIKIITGAGHAVLIEKPLELNQAIAEFINNLKNN